MSGDIKKLLESIDSISTVNEQNDFPRQAIDYGSGMKPHQESEHAAKDKSNFENDPRWAEYNKLQARQEFTQARELMNRMRYEHHMDESTEKTHNMKKQQTNESMWDEDVGTDPVVICMHKDGHKMYFKEFHANGNYYWTADKGEARDFESEDAASDAIKMIKAHDPAVYKMGLVGKTHGEKPYPIYAEPMHEIGEDVDFSAEASPLTHGIDNLDMDEDWSADEYNRQKMIDAPKSRQHNPVSAPGEHSYIPRSHELEEENDNGQDEIIQDLSGKLQGPWPLGGDENEMSPESLAARNRLQRRDNEDEMQTRQLDRAMTRRADMGEDSPMQADLDSVIDEFYTSMPSKQAGKNPKQVGESIVLEGRKMFKDLSGWKSHASKLGFKVKSVNGDKDVNYTYHAVDKDGKVKGKFATLKVAQNNHGYINESIELTEKSAPGQESWIKANKSKFVKEYGKKKGLEVLYATAWKRSKKNESVSEGMFDSPEEKMLAKVKHIFKIIMMHKSELQPHDLKYIQGVVNNSYGTDARTLEKMYDHLRQFALLKHLVSDADTESVDEQVQAFESMFAEAMENKPMTKKTKKINESFDLTQTEDTKKIVDSLGSMMKLAGLQSQKAEYKPYVAESEGDVFSRMMDYFDIEAPESEEGSGEGSGENCSDDGDTEVVSMSSDGEGHFSGLADNIKALATGKEPGKHFGGLADKLNALKDGEVDEERETPNFKGIGDKLRNHFKKEDPRLKPGVTNNPNDDDPWDTEEIERRKQKDESVNEDLSATLTMSKCEDGKSMSLTITDQHGDELDKLLCLSGIAQPQAVAVVSAHMEPTNGEAPEQAPGGYQGAYEMVGEADEQYADPDKEPTGEYGDTHEYSNRPKRDVYDLDTQINKGSDLNSPKGQYAKEYDGDNRMDTAKRDAAFESKETDDDEDDTPKRGHLFDDPKDRDPESDLEEGWMDKFKKVVGKKPSLDDAIADLDRARNEKKAFSGKIGDHAQAADYEDDLTYSDEPKSWKKNESADLEEGWTDKFNKIGKSINKATGGYDKDRIDAQHKDLDNRERRAYEKGDAESEALSRMTGWDKKDKPSESVAESKLWAEYKGIK